MRILIVGLGLIGGSLAAASRKKFPKARIIGVTRNQKALQTAKRKGWIQEGYRDLRQALVGAPLRGRPLGWFQGGHTGPPLHLVILCTPVDTLKNYLKRLDRMAPKGTVVTDAGSVKGFLVRWVDRQKWRRIEFVGAHPMAGSHRRGMDAADPHLFDGTLTFITPSVRATHALPLRIVKNFWRKICSRIVIVSPKEHDRITAEISHLPHLLAALLVTGVPGRLLRFSGPGFLDTTRIAQGSPEIWTPIFHENRRELLRKLQKFGAGLTRAKDILKKGDIGKLRALLTEAQKRRKALK